MVLSSREGRRRDRFIRSPGRTPPEMQRYVRTLIYGMVAFAVYAGISFMLGGRVNWILAAATAAGVMIAVFFIVPRRRR